MPNSLELNEKFRFFVVSLPIDRLIEPVEPKFGAEKKNSHSMSASTTLACDGEKPFVPFDISIIPLSWNSFFSLLVGNAIAGDEYLISSWLSPGATRHLPPATPFSRRKKCQMLKLKILFTFQPEERGDR